MNMFQYLKFDFRSSVVVFLVALPLCLGIALASQAPLAAGLISGIVGGLVVAAISASPLSVSGPAAGLAVIVAYSIQELGDYKTFSLAVLFSGVAQILFSVVRAGKLGNFFPTSVIKGMLSAIGLILILKQIPHAIGFDADYFGSESFEENDGNNTLSAIGRAMDSFEIGCVMISAFSFALIALWDRISDRTGIKFFKLVPSALLAVGISSIVNFFFLRGTRLEIEPKHLVQLPFEGGFQNFFNTLNFPDWNALSNPLVYKVALTIAIVGSLESLLSIDAADKIDEEKRTTPKNRELLAQGVGNTVAGFFGGLPITAVIVRTSANVNAGAKTKLSAILHGLWFVIAVVFVPQSLNMIPLATLATILILVGYKLTKPKLYFEMYSKGMDQFIPFVTTILAILLTDLLKGIVIGMVVGFIFVFKRNLHRSVVMVNDENNNTFLIKFVKDISFLQKDRLIQMLTSIPENAHVVIDGSKDVYIDTDIIELVDDFRQSSSSKNINVSFKKSSTALSPYFKL